MKREGDKLIATPPFHPYDPFDYYWPQGRGTRGERSLLYLFLNVDSNNADQIVSFTERFGVLGDAKKNGWSYLLSENDKKKAAKEVQAGLEPIAEREKRHLAAEL